jgi:hypothetical protein
LTVDDLPVFLLPTGLAALVELASLLSSGVSGKRPELAVVVVEPEGEFSRRPGRANGLVGG